MKCKEKGVQCNTSALFLFCKLRTWDEKISKVFTYSAKQEHSAEKDCKII